MTCNFRPGTSSVIATGNALAQIKAEKRIEVIHAEDGQALDYFVQKAVRWIEDRVMAVVA